MRVFSSKQNEIWHSSLVRIWRDIQGAATEPRDSRSVAVLGTFDGVHRGHRYLFERASRTAEQEGVQIVAMTFDPHPMQVIRPELVPPALSSIERRVEFLRAAGADEVRVLAFSREIASWQPEEFVARVLVDELRAARVVAGENFTFGYKASGTMQTLTENGRTHGFSVDTVALQRDSEPYSSTRVRRFLAAGDVAAAAAILGRPAEVEGVVVRGDQRGRELGFPTANIPASAALAVPSDGVYATWVVRADGTRLPAATSVGTNPTFEGVAGRRVESYVLDRTDLELYGERLRVEFVEKIRGMEAFDDVAALLDQMNADVEKVRNILLL